MRVTIFKDSSRELLEYEINKFIEDKTIVSITFKTEVIYNRINYIAFITYKED